MTQLSRHGPENAEHEIKKAFNGVIETGVVHFWRRASIPGVDPYEVITIYRRAFDVFRKSDRLLAERWARAAKHLSRAFWHEAKIAYFSDQTSELPCLERALNEYGLRDRGGSTRDLLESLAGDVPPGFPEMPEDMRRHLSRGRKHLSELEEGRGTDHEMIRAERVNAAHEYGRVVECLALAYEAGGSRGKSAA